MKIMSWNIRGLNSHHKKDVLLNFVRDHKPDLIFVQETKMPKDKVESLRNFQNCGVHGNSFAGASGGIVTFWNKMFIKGEPLMENGNVVATRFTHIRDNFC